jgi:hypothetical protein
MPFSRHTLLLLLPLVGPAVLLGQVERDSAGIHIVENRTPLLAPARLWRVEARPTLSIGGLSDDPRHELHRVMGATRLRDGRIAIGNQASSSIRFFGPDGRFLSEAGRSGDGPGEFRQILGMFPLPGDTLLVGDLRRIHVYSSEGRHIRSNEPQGDGRPFLFPLGVLGDGSYIGTPWTGPVPGPSGASRWIDSTEMYRVAANWQVNSIARLPNTVSTPGRSLRQQSRLVFGPVLRIAARGDAIYAGFPLRYEIAVMTSTGGVQRIIRRNHEPRPVPRSVVSEYRERGLNAPGEDGRPAPPQMRALREEYYGSMQFASTFPPYSTLLVDREGNLWAQEYEWWEDAPDRWGPVSLLTPPGESRWDVFTPLGRWLGTVTMPARIRPLEIGADYVLGLWRDADDVEHVRLHRLVKP